MPTPGPKKKTVKKQVAEKRKTKNRPIENVKATTTGWVDVYEKLPFPKAGKTNIESARGKSGVYFIKEDGKQIYIGHSQSDVYTTLLRHFQKGQKRKSNYYDTVLTKNYRVKIVFVPPKVARTWETDLIYEFKPRDNEQNKYNKGKSKGGDKLPSIKQAIANADEVPF